MKSAESITATRSLFQAREGGSTPTSAHNIVLQTIPRRLAAACYRKWHYLGETDFISTYNFGIFVGSELFGCISLGSPNAKELDGHYTRYTQEGWWEIKRLALSDELPKNSESRAIAIAIRLLRRTVPVKGIVTYADDGVGHKGTIYKASGFTYKGLTAAKNDYWVDGKILQRGATSDKQGEWRPRSRKHLFIKTF